MENKKEVLTETEIRERIKNAKNKTVFTEEEIFFICRKQEDEWLDKELAVCVKNLIYPNLGNKNDMSKKENNIITFTINNPNPEEHIFILGSPPNQIPIKALDLSKRTFWKVSFVADHVQDILDIGEEGFLKFRQVGPGTIQEIKKALKPFKLKLPKKSIIKSEE